VSYAAITLFVVSRRVFIVVAAADFVIDSVRKLFDIASYTPLEDPVHFLEPRCIVTK
jgi:hypothetical protein